MTECLCLLKCHVIKILWYARCHYNINNIHKFTVFNSSQKLNCQYCSMCGGSDGSFSKTLTISYGFIDIVQGSVNKNGSFTI